MPVKTKSIALLGASGMLGTDLRVGLQKLPYTIKTYSRPEFDITNMPILQEAVKASEIIINCAAYTNVDKAESETEIAEKVNTLAVGSLGRFAATEDKYVIHISTDFVYDGMKKSPYNELDTPNPISVYGKTKYEGEKLLSESGCRHCIVRVQWTYGAAGANFISKICKRAESADTISVVTDQIGSPTHTRDVANIVRRLAVGGQIEGLYLFASQGYASRLEVAEFIAKTLNLKVNVKPCKTADFPSPACRPLNSRFDCTKIDSITNSSRIHWRESLFRYLK